MTYKLYFLFLLSISVFNQSNCLAKPSEFEFSNYKNYSMKSSWIRDQYRRSIEPVGDNRLWLFLFDKMLLINYQGDVLATKSIDGGFTSLQGVEEINVSLCNDGSLYVVDRSGLYYIKATQENETHLEPIVDPSQISQGKLRSHRTLCVNGNAVIQSEIDWSYSDYSKIPDWRKPYCNWRDPDSKYYDQENMCIESSIQVFDRRGKELFSLSDQNNKKIALSDVDDHNQTLLVIRKVKRIKDRHKNQTNVKSADIYDPSFNKIMKTSRFVSANKKYFFMGDKFYNGASFFEYDGKKIVRVGFINPENLSVVIEEYPTSIWDMIPIPHRSAGNLSEVFASASYIPYGEDEYSRTFVKLDKNLSKRIGFFYRYYDYSQKDPSFVPDPNLVSSYFCGSDGYAYLSYTLFKDGKMVPIHSKIQIGYDRKSPNRETCHYNSHMTETVMAPDHTMIVLSGGVLIKDSPNKAGLEFYKLKIED